MRRLLVAVSVLAAVLCTVAPASAQYRFERRLDLQAGGILTLDAEEGRVTVVGDDSLAARIGVFAQYGNFRVFTVSTPTEARIEVDRRDSWLEWLLHEWWPRDRDTRVIVRVPRMTDIRIRTSGGPIHATRLAGSLDVRTAGGDVRVDHVDGTIAIYTGGGPIHARDIGGNLFARTAGGGVSIVGVNGAVNVQTGGGPILVNGAVGPISARTSGGGVTIAAAGDRVDAHSGGGPVSVAFARGNRAGGDVSSAGGRVVAAIDPSVPLTIDAASGGGTVASYIPVTTRAAFNRRTLTGNVNGGGSLLRLRSFGGPVEIAALRQTP